MQQISGATQKGGSVCQELRGGEGNLEPGRTVQPFCPGPLPFTFLKVAQWVGVSHTRLENGGSLLLYQHYPLLATEGLASSTPTLGAGLALQSWAPRPPKMDFPLRGQEILHLAQMSKKIIVPETQVFLLFNNSSNLTPAA